MCNANEWKIENYCYLGFLIPTIYFGYWSNENSIPVELRIHEFGILKSNLGRNEKASIIEYVKLSRALLSDLF